MRGHALRITTVSDGIFDKTDIHLASILYKQQERHNI